MSKARHISFEELAGNLVELLNEVRGQHTTLVVEYPNGGNVQIKPHATTRRSARQDTAAVATERKRQPRASGTRSARTLSTMGAVHDLDPNSITPG